MGTKTILSKENSGSISVYGSLFWGSHLKHFRSVFHDIVWVNKLLSGEVCTNKWLKMFFLLSSKYYFPLSSCYWVFSVFLFTPLWADSVNFAVDWRKNWRSVDGRGRDKSCNKCASSLDIRFLWSSREGRASTGCVFMAYIILFCLKAWLLHNTVFQSLWSNCLCNIDVCVCLLKLYYIYFLASQRMDCGCCLPLVLKTFFF